MSINELVLVGSFREGAEFRAQENIPVSAVVRTRDAIGGRRPHRVHLLPEFFGRRDLPAWRATLRTLLRNSPRTQVLVWEYGSAGFVHTHDVRIDMISSTFVPLEKDSTRPEPRPKVVKVDPVPDTEVPGQISLEEVLASTIAEPIPVPRAMAIVPLPDDTEVPADHVERVAQLAPHLPREEGTCAPGEEPLQKPKPRAKQRKGAAKPKVEKDEFLADLEAKGIIEPEGFELSDDPQVQAKQILESAAHAAPDDSFGDF